MGPTSTSTIACPSRRRKSRRAPWTTISACASSRAKKPPASASSTRTSTATCSTRIPPTRADSTCWSARTITSTWRRRAATRAPWPSRWRGCATTIDTATERAQKGVRHERGTSTGWYTQGRVRPDVGRQTRPVGHQWPPLWGLGDLPPQGLARGSQSAVRVAVHRLVRAADPALQRRGQDVGVGRQQVRVRRRPGHSLVVRRHAAPVGVHASLASRTVPDRSGYHLRRGSRRRLVPLGGWRPDMAGAPRTAWPRLGVLLAAGCRRVVPAHDPSGPQPSRADLHRPLGGGRPSDPRPPPDKAGREPPPPGRTKPPPHGPGKVPRSPP